MKALLFGTYPRRYRYSKIPIPKDVLRAVRSLRTVISRDGDHLGFANAVRVSKDGFITTAHGISPQDIIKVGGVNHAKGVLWTDSYQITNRSSEKDLLFLYSKFQPVYSACPIIKLAAQPAEEGEDCYLISKNSKFHGPHIFQSRHLGVWNVNGVQQSLYECLSLKNKPESNLQGFSGGAIVNAFGELIGCWNGGQRLPELDIPTADGRMESVPFAQLKSFINQ